VVDDEFKVLAIQDNSLIVEAQNKKIYLGELLLLLGDHHQQNQRPYRQETSEACHITENTLTVSLIQSAFLEIR
jgi:hypothetical protein